MRQWEGMGWPEFEAAVRHGCGAMLPGEEDKVVRCMGRMDQGTARGIVVLTVQGVGLRSGHFRESGLWSEEWQKELQRSGMKRGIVQDLVRVLHKGIARLEKEVWGKRAEVMEGMGLGATKGPGSKDNEWWREPGAPEAQVPQSKEERDQQRRMGSLLSRGGQMNLYEAGCTSKAVQAGEGGRPSVSGESPVGRAEGEQQHHSTTKEAPRDLPEAQGTALQPSQALNTNQVQGQDPQNQTQPREEATHGKLGMGRGKQMWKKGKRQEVRRERGVAKHKLAQGETEVSRRKQEDKLAQAKLQQERCVSEQQRRTEAEVQQRAHRQLVKQRQRETNTRGAV